MIELRNTAAAEPRTASPVPQSALDFSWMDHVDAGAGVFITAEGLLMYLQPEEAMSLIPDCAQRVRRTDVVRPAAGVLRLPRPAEACPPRGATGCRRCRSA